MADAETQQQRLDPSAALLTEPGLPVLVISSYGATLCSTLGVSMIHGNNDLFLVWRKKPEVLSCEMHFIRSIEKSFSCARRLVVSIGESVDYFDLTVELQDMGEQSGEVVCELLYQRLCNLLLIAQETASAYGSGGMGGKASTLEYSSMQVATRMELCYQLGQVLRYKEGNMIMEKLVIRSNKELPARAFKQWTLFVKSANAQIMATDRSRWRLHAAANQDMDLQAWYHAMFYQEVYRLRGPFWFRDAVLPQYRQSYDLVDNALTPLEEAALAHVLCSPDTTYGDVAGQMFVVQAIVSPEQFALFQQLSAQGAQVIKCPRSGRPAKKMFRFSFVEGNIYLTWKGKFGNQGVDLGDVSSVVGGITTDVIKRTAQASRSDCYLSLICAGRSVDLCFDNHEDREKWLALLSMLVEKEHGQLSAVDSVRTHLDEATPFENLLLFASLGKETLTPEKRHELCSMRLAE